MSFYKTGTISTPSIVEALSIHFDNTIYTEPDGSKWIRIFHHNNPANALFVAADTFTSSVYKDADRWFNVSLCYLESNWELMIIQAPLSTDTAEKYRWIQNVNPMIAAYSDVALDNITRITTSGYTTPTANSGNYAGLYKDISNKSYILCNNGSSGTYWGDIGGWTAYQGGIPGYNGKVITSGYIDLYLRISSKLETYFNINKASIYNEAITSISFIER